MSANLSSEDRNVQDATHPVSSAVLNGQGLPWFLGTAIIIGIIIAGKTLPVAWSDNEINYFDLAYRFVAPEAFGPDHSVFDRSQSRAVSFTLLGGSISWLGFETTKTIFGLLLCALYAVGLAFAAQKMRLNIIAIALSLVIYLALGQALLGGEWLFRTVEGKVFAYSVVIFALGFSFEQRWVTAVILLAIATYFHFLVGIFWAAAVLGLMFLTTGRVIQVIRFGCLFSVLILPILIVLLRERLGVNVNMAGLDLTLGEIYAEFRSAHHVAPFYPRASTFVPLLAAWRYRSWTNCLSSLAPCPPGARPVVRWLVWLNAYIPLVIVIAFFRSTYTCSCAVLPLSAVRADTAPVVIGAFAACGEIGSPLFRRDVGHTRADAGTHHA